MLPAAVPVNGDPLQAQGVGRQIDLAHVVGGGLVGEVNRLGDRIVGELLEGRLKLDVPEGGDLVGGDEEVPQVPGISLISRMEPLWAMPFMSSGE